MKDVSIHLFRAEGFTDDPDREATVASFAEADEVLQRWALTAPANGGYDKCDFVVTAAPLFGRGEPDEYKGRFDLEREHAEQSNLLQAQMVRMLAFTYGIDPDLVRVEQPPVEPPEASDFWRRAHESHNRPVDACPLCQPVAAAGAISPPISEWSQDDYDAFRASGQLD